MNFAFDLNRKHSNLDFETKFAQIRYEFTEINQFQKCQVDFNFQNFANLGLRSYVRVFSIQIKGKIDN